LKGDTHRCAEPAKNTLIGTEEVTAEREAGRSATTFLEGCVLFLSLFFFSSLTLAIYFLLYTI
jgi:hypothetical protein